MAKILVAEDDQFLASAYRVKLTKAGFEVKIAVDGAEAIKAAKEFQPQVILLDLVMPVKDGFATLVDLKKDETLAKIPVIVSSNLGQKEDIDRAKSLGAVDYIVKSDTGPNEMVAIISKYV